MTYNIELVKRLRTVSDPNRATDVGLLWNICSESADAIETLENESTQRLFIVETQDRELAFLRAKIRTQEETIKEREHALKLVAEVVNREKTARQATEDKVEKIKVLLAQIDTALKGE